MTREPVEVQHVEQVANVIIAARDLVRAYKAGGYVGKECDAISTALERLDAVRYATREPGMRP